MKRNCGPICSISKHITMINSSQQLMKVRKIIRGVNKLPAITDNDLFKKKSATLKFIHRVVYIIWYNINDYDNFV